MDAAISRRMGEAYAAAPDTVLALLACLLMLCLLHCLLQVRTRVNVDKRLMVYSQAMVE